MRQTTRQMRSSAFGPAMLRIAGWPTETIDGLCSKHLADEVDHWLAQKEQIVQEAAQISNSLHSLIPKIPRKDTRANVLALRRSLRRSTEVLPRRLLHSLLPSELVPLELKETIVSHSAVRENHLEKYRQLKHLYELSLTAERQELYRLVGDPLFQKALYLASPTTFRALQSGARKTKKRSAKLEQTLHSYVIRSVGRATPNALWAGVVLETTMDQSEAGIHIEPAPSRAYFSPNLSPFIRALRAIPYQAPWRKEIPLRLNPTLFQTASSAWVFGNQRNGCWKVFQCVNHPLIEYLTSLFSDSQTNLPGEIERQMIENKIASSEEQAEKIVSDMLDAGILWTTLEIPTTYADPCEALYQVTHHLSDKEKSHWKRCVRRLRKICRHLSLRCWEMPLTEMQQQMSTARECVNDLLGRYGVSAEAEDTHVLIADMSAPFCFSLSANLRSKIERAVQLYWSFDRFGLGEIQVDVDRHVEFGDLQSRDTVPIFEFVQQKEVAKMGARQREAANTAVERSSATFNGKLAPWEAVLTSINEPTLKARAEASFGSWYKELDKVFIQQQHRLQAERTSRRKSLLAPGSALILLGSPSQGGAIRIGSVTPDPCLFYSRFSTLFASNGEHDDVFRKWYRQSISKTESHFSNLQFADLGVRILSNPNAASRPAMTARCIDGLNKNDDFLKTLNVQLDHARRPSACVSGKDLKVLPRLHSAVSLQDADPYSQCLYRFSTFLGRPSLMSPMPRFSMEIEQWHHLPRLYLDESTVISPERWTPPRSVVEKLKNSSGLDRYIAWRKFVNKHRLPRLVYGQYGSRRTEVLIVADSILGIENMGRTLASKGGTLLLQEAFPSPSQSWLIDSDGRHYLAELVVAWEGEESFWKDYLNLGGASSSKQKTPLN